MATPTQSIEVLFLKIFKGTVLFMMGLALISILLLCFNAAYQYSQTPKQPAPAQKAPEKDPVKEINMESLKQFLIDREKQENDKEEPSKSSDERQASILLFSYASQIYACSVDFGKKVGATIEEANDSRNINELRWKLERIASSPLLGEAWVKAAQPFICTALTDETIVALKKDGKVKSVFYPIIEFHAETWKKIQNEKVKFEQNEKDRVKSEWEAEVSRVHLAEAEALTSLIAAGCSFGGFMFLALYLLAAKIETNLRDINDAIRKKELH
jgi:hypothetical protein